MDAGIGTFTGIGIRRYIRKSVPLRGDALNALPLTMLSYSQVWFGLRCLFPVWGDWNIHYTRKGRAKIFFKRAIQMVVGILTLVASYQARQSGQGLSYFSANFLHLSAYLTNKAQRMSILK